MAELIEPQEEEPVDAILLDDDRLQTVQRDSASSPVPAQVGAVPAAFVTNQDRMMSRRSHHPLLIIVAIFGLFFFCSGWGCLFISFLLPHRFPFGPQ
jgi:hypothetical protein